MAELCSAGARREAAAGAGSPYQRSRCLPGQARLCAREIVGVNLVQNLCQYIQRQAACKTQISTQATPSNLSDWGCCLLRTPRRATLLAFRLRAGAG